MVKNPTNYQSANLGILYHDTTIKKRDLIISVDLVLRLIRVPNRDDSKE